MKKNHQHVKISWTAEDRSRHRAIRETFRDWHPGLEELLATGEYIGPIRHGAYLDFRAAMHALKQERERQGLSLSDVAKRSGLDAAAISRLENGKQPNPTLETLLRYVDALGQRLLWRFKPARTSQSTHVKVGRRKRSKV